MAVQDAKNVDTILKAVASHHGQAPLTGAMIAAFSEDISTGDIVVLDDDGNVRKANTGSLQAGHSIVGIVNDAGQIHAHGPFTMTDPFWDHPTRQTKKGHTNKPKVIEQGERYLDI